jgi:hypothetical protein
LVLNTTHGNRSKICQMLRTRSRNSSNVIPRYSLRPLGSSLRSIHILLYHSTQPTFTSVTSSDRHSWFAFLLGILLGIFAWSCLYLEFLLGVVCFVWIDFEGAHHLLPLVVVCTSRDAHHLLPLVVAWLQFAWFGLTSRERTIYSPSSFALREMRTIYSLSLSLGLQFAWFGSTSRERATYSPSSSLLVSFIYSLLLLYRIRGRIFLLFVGLSR